MSGHRRATFTASRANPPICWLCDKALYAGGRSYVIVQGEQGEHPSHRQCADDQHAAYREPAKRAALAGGEGRR